MQVPPTAGDESRAAHLPAASGEPSEVSADGGPAGLACPGPDGGAAGRGLSRFFRRLRLPTMRCAGAGRASAALPGTGGRAGALARPARCAAAALLLAFAALLALPLQAEAVILVDNLELSTTGSIPKVGGDNNRVVAQKFSVPDGADYILSDLTIWVEAVGEHPIVVTIRRGSGSSPPASVIHTLIGPASPASGHRTFTAPSDARLEAGKSYYVMLKAESSGGTQSSVWTESNTNENGLEGWTIANRHLVKAAGPWTNLNSALRIRLRGREVSNNANLSDLALEKPLSGDAIELDQTFSASKNNYTASVSNRQSVVKLTATQDHSGATVAIEDDVDIGTQTPNEARLSLDVGSNTLRVTVTAETGREKNYRVVVTRAQPPNIPATGAPAITGVPQAGKVLTAGLGTIADSDGLPSGSGGFTYQWVRVDADGVSNPRNRGTNSPTYTPVAGDAGKKIVVKVSFNDDRGYAEGPLSSAAYPSSGTVMAPKGACPADQRKFVLNVISGSLTQSWVGSFRWRPCAGWGSDFAAIVAPDGSRVGRERRLRRRLGMAARPAWARGWRRGDGRGGQGALSRALVAGRRCRSF